MKAHVKLDSRGQAIGFLLPDGRVVDDEEYVVWLALAASGTSPLEAVSDVVVPKVDTSKRDELIDKIQECLDRGVARDQVTVLDGWTRERAKIITTIVLDVLDLFE